MLRLPSRPCLLSNNHNTKRLISTMSTISSSSSPIPSKHDPTHQQQQQQQQESSSLKQVLQYHNQTKHSFTNYARGPHGLDWANQPNPFRQYTSSPLLPLQHFPSPPHHHHHHHHLPYHSLFLSPQPPQPLSLPTLSHLLYHSLSLSAWKSTPHSTWSLRVNPSSGNLHPTETHLISPPIPSLSRSAFAAHYAPKHHSLHLRSSPIPSQFFLPTFFPKSSFLVGFSSVFWREAWKYGERAFRYCNHDVGHAIAALAIAAAGLGWDVKILDGLGFCDLEKVMGMNGNGEFEIPARPVKGRMPEIEFDHPDCVVVVFPNGGEGFEVDFGKLSSLISEVFDEVEWVGKPNLLSKEHVCWDIIYRTAEAVKKPLTATDRFKVDPFVSSGLISENVYKGMSASEVIRKRRSAVDMDGVHVMERETFYQIMLHCLPSGVQSGDGGGKQGKQLALPFRVLTWEAEVHAVLFVHRVAGLPIGLYFLVRNDDHFDELKRSTRSEFEWERPEGCPANLPLYRLLKGDFKQISRRVSCHQDIASDGCFSLGMVARFEQTLQQNVWMYPRLFWESGVLGQVLYLEAHAVGISATGIGCYFDDAVHEILGLSGLKFQSLYHFTVGAPVLDKRIMSLPAYPGPDIDA